MTGPGDGYIDGVHALRNTYYADVVSLITETPGSPYCGVAWLWRNRNPGFAPYAFSVVELACMTGYYSFGHEIGHNMGLNHARSDQTGTGAYSYSYGYKWTGYRTVMAYAPGTRGSTSRTRTSRTVATPPASARPPAARVQRPQPHNTRVTVANWRSRRHPSPNGGEARPARPEHLGLGQPPAGAIVRIAYTDGTGRGFTTNRTTGGAIASVPASQGSYSWTVPSNTGSAWRVKLCVPTASPARGTAGGSCLVSDTSDAPFSIVP